MDNNPLRHTDPKGMASKDVIIKGDKANETFNQLKASTSLKLKMDDNGKVTASGKAKTPADEKLLEAITNSKVVVNIDATSSNYASTGEWFIGGGFGGSTIDANGVVQTSQTVNPNMTEKIDNFYDVGRGVSVLHEVLESYIGGQDSPGTAPPSFEDVENQTPSGIAYLSAHEKANAIDPRHKDNNIVDAGTEGIYISKFPYDATIPESLNPLILINNLSK